MNFGGIFLGGGNMRVMYLRKINSMLKMNNSNINLEQFESLLAFYN